MALKTVVVLGVTNSQYGWKDLGSKPSVFPLNRINESEKVCKWMRFGGFPGLSACRAIRSVENENTSNRGTKLQQIVDQTENDVSRRLQKDLNSLPRPLSISDLSAIPDGGSKVRISFKGLPGSYSEDAALKAYPKCETVPCNDFEDAFKAVELWLADKAVLPIENSSGGSIHRNYDLLLRHRLQIVGEVQLNCNLCLLALPGVRAEHLKRVLSHSQALSLSDILLSKLGVSRENVDDTAGAAQYVSSNGLRDAGVVASARAAEIYGLNILAERIQDDFDNVTRYLVLARDPIIPRTNKPFKTSIVFTLDEGPGVLFKALAVFALRDINLKKIESRPQRKRPLRVVDDSNTGRAKYFDYLFYIDFEASMAEPRAQNALGHLQEFATFLRILGCYPMDTTL
ncbi:arogenate dehydratase/prephenate dehydratase 1, chloroplastic-like isoform X1 [Quercus robur]|uniref:arogenate dehydratase/prephenate dehydratase 1, chloroplastic-like isoform X1 n=1 Tax=Quercus robur TaxID=38942 RepID=UPI0021612ADF|nr:arogenate dehydratase/prephenate dehydratase 1, chloroplastic-like isoform X1 [Quercus robur]